MFNCCAVVGKISIYLLMREGGGGGWGGVTPTHAVWSSILIRPTWLRSARGDSFCFRASARFCASGVSRVHRPMTLGAPQLEFKRTAHRSQRASPFERRPGSYQYQCSLSLWHLNCKTLAFNLACQSYTTVLLDAEKYFSLRSKTGEACSAPLNGTPSSLVCIFHFRQRDSCRG